MLQPPAYAWPALGNSTAGGILKKTHAMHSDFQFASGFF